jgi:branched-chain amino acid aminotransferase
MEFQFELEGSSLRPLGDRPEGGLEAPPDGVYTTLRTHGGDRVVRLRQHADRLNDSARLRGLAGQVREDDVRRAIALGLRETRYPESRLRLTFAPPRLYVGIEPFVALPAALYRDGVACSIVPLRRRNPHAKDTRFASEAASAYETLPTGAHEGLMVAPDGALLEGLSSNFFALVDGTLKTEEARALAGVTRSLVIEVARGVLPVALEAAGHQDLPAVSECFITSVSRGILPVVRIDDYGIGTGRPGPVTRDLMARLEGLVAREAERIALPESP